MDGMKSMKKFWINSLGFLDNSVINSIIVCILFLYASTIFENINHFVGDLYNFSLVKLLVLALIVYVAPKDTTIAILLAISYVISLNYMTVSENFKDEKKNEIQKGMHKATESVKKGVYDASNDVKKGLHEATRNVKKGIHEATRDDKNKVEHFFPLVNGDMNGNSTDSLCMQNYVPQHESVGNVCTPVATFDGELNAQGLNMPEGFGSPSAGAPLGN